MGAITGTLAKKTEFSGDYGLFKVTCTPAAASDTVTLVAATHGLTEILGVLPQITAGQDANLAFAFASFSGLVITLTTYQQDMTAANDWTAAAVTLWVVGR